MARKTRIFVNDTPQHIIIRGLEDIFKDKEDYEYFYSSLKESLLKSGVDLHAYVLMSNHIHLLSTPKYAESISILMQSIGRKYVLYFNKKYNRKGTLWESRYKSSLVQPNIHLLNVMNYIEQNPKRKGLVKDAKEYAYSSVKHYALGIEDEIITQHLIYTKLSENQKKRAYEYGLLLNKDLDIKKLTFIRDNLNKQKVTGSIEFRQRVEKTLGINLQVQKRGRPKKENLKRKEMYKKLVALDRQKHKNIKITPLKSLEFAKNSVFLPVLAREAALIGKDFPLLFTSDEFPSFVALFSLGGENLAINTEYKWITNYLPSAIRKYPFALATNNQNTSQKIIMIDEESTCVSEIEGAPLFDENLEQTDALKNAINFLTNYESQMTTTQNVAKEIADSKILEDREITIGEGGEKKTLVKGFRVVNEEKYRALPDELLAKWVRIGITTLIDTHLNSLAHIDTLFTLASRRAQI